MLTLVLLEANFLNINKNLLLAVCTDEEEASGRKAFGDISGHIWEMLESKDLYAGCEMEVSHPHTFFCSENSLYENNWVNFYAEHLLNFILSR